MAGLTDRLPLTDGTNRVFEGIQEPSALGAVLDFVGEAMEGYQSLKKDMSANAARKAAAEEKKTKAEAKYQASGAPAGALEDTVRHNSAVIAGKTAISDLGNEAAANAPNEGAQGFWQINEDGSTSQGTETGLSANDVQEIKNAASRTLSVATAVQQGRMPQITVEASINARFRALREKFPNNVDDILDIFQKMNVAKNLSTELQDAADEREFNREQQQSSRDDERKFRRIAIEESKRSWGAAGLTMTDDEHLLQGIELVRQSYEADAGEKLLRAKLGNATLTADAAKGIKEEYNQKIERDAAVHGFNGAAIYIAEVQKLANVMSKDPNNPDNVQRWLALGVQAKTLAGVSAERAYTFALSKGYTGDRSAFVATRTAQMAPLLDMFSGEFSVVQANVKALEAITVAGKITNAEALPLFTSLQAAGMKPTEMAGFMQAIDKDPKLRQALSDEIRGYSQDWGKDRASTRLLNIRKLLMGQSTFSQMPPDQVAKHIPGLVNSTNALAIDYNKGKDVSPDLIANGAGEIAVATRALTPQASSITVLLAAKGFGSLGVRNALVKAATDPNSDKAALLPTIQASRAAGAHINDIVRLRLGVVNRDNPYFKAVWDDKNAKWGIDDTGLKNALASARRGQGGGSLNAQSMDMAGSRVARLTSMKKPTEMLQLVEAANMSLDNAIDLGRVDPTTPKGTDLELRRWYGQDKRLPGEKNKDNKEINPEAEIDKMFQSIDKQFEAAIGQSTKPVSLPVEGFAGAIKGAENPGNNPAQKNLAGTSSAMGNGQFVSRTWMGLVDKYRPDLKEGRSRDEILALRADPELASEMINNYGEQNRQVLAAAGVPTGFGELYLAHFLDGPVAAKVLKADPSTPIEQLVSAAAVKANDWLRGKSAAWVINWAKKKVGAK